MEDERIDAADFEIDRYNLDEEWERQPRRYLKWAERLAEARRELDYAKQALDVGIAEVDRDIRNRPEAYDLKKVTEAVVETLIPSTKKYLRLNSAVIEAKYKVAMLDASVSAMEHKKKALENEVHLHLSSYHATPRSPDSKGAEEAMDEAVKQRVRRRGQQKAR